ncbi:hypothetical protein ACFQ1S_04085 [Kibdelosporangium lantanae]|uniref:Uncharacterized protein n=1 Tax=Kibdelosporangium lantanae TaxID=1497396 RepID=A0ABW3M765_9PSEU
MNSRVTPARNEGARRWVVTCGATGAAAEAVKVAGGELAVRDPLE